MPLCAHSTVFLTNQMNKCIRMGITAFKIVICRGKVLFLAHLRAIALPPVLALALALVSASTNVKVSLKF